MSGIFGNHFYHRITRKIVVAFGSLFNELQLVRYNKAGTTELERMLVPIVYAQKEKFYNRIKGDPNLLKSIQVSLPRISFEIIGIEYDPTRKQNSLIRNTNQATATSTTQKTQYMGIPYNYDFSLSIYVRNIEDGWQIVEQILPIFNPDYTLTLDLVSSMGIKKDVPILLNSVAYTVDYESSHDEDTTRMVIFDLSFTVRAMLFGPISDSKIITKANTNIYGSYTSGSAGGSSIYVLNLQSGGFNSFKEGELIWQGGTYQFPDAKAEVIEHDTLNRKLYIKDVYGSKNGFGAFTSNVDITGASSGASWNVASSYVSNIKLVIGSVIPDPTTANVNSDFGFTETIIEFPNTLGQ
jgi:hypothetical protein